MKKYQKKICIISSSRADYGIEKFIKNYTGLDLIPFINYWNASGFKHGYTLKRL